MDVSKAPRVLGFDAIGVVESVGNEVTMFNQGDIVYYSGSPDQNGSNAEYQLINERLVAKAPKNISRAGSKLTINRYNDMKHCLMCLVFHATVMKMKVKRC